METFTARINTFLTNSCRLSVPGAATYRYFNHHGTGITAETILNAVKFVVLRATNILIDGSRHTGTLVILDALLTVLRHPTKYCLSEAILSSGQ